MSPWRLATFPSFSFACSGVKADAVISVYRSPGSSNYVLFCMWRRQCSVIRTFTYVQKQLRHLQQLSSWVAGKSALLARASAGESSHSKAFCLRPYIRSTGLLPTPPYLPQWCDLTICILVSGLLCEMSAGILSREMRCLASETKILAMTRLAHVIDRGRKKPWSLGREWLLIVYMLSLVII